MDYNEVKSIIEIKYPNKKIVYCNDIENYFCFGITDKDINPYDEELYETVAEISVNKTTGEIVNFDMEEFQDMYKDIL